MSHKLSPFTPFIEKQEINPARQRPLSIHLYYQKMYKDIFGITNSDNKDLTTSAANIIIESVTSASLHSSSL